LHHLKLPFIHSATNGVSTVATEDQQLVILLLHQADDSEAWSRIDKLYRRRLTCYARTFFKNDNYSENIVQEALTGLFNSFRNKKFDENRSLQAYLYAITRNLAISQIRKNSRGIHAGGEANENIEQSGPGVSSLYRSEEDRLHREVVIVAALREYISSLKKGLKFETIKILELVWIRGLGNNEAADALGINPQVVANTKFQGRKALADIVQRTTTITHPDLITPPAFNEIPQNHENLVYSREYIHAHIDGALSQEETDAFDLEAQVNSELRGQIRAVQSEFDYHNHTVGSLWRRNQLTCPSDQDIADYLRGGLAIINPEIADYVQFHLTSIRCIYCISTAAELKQSAAKGGTT